MKKYENLFIYSILGVFLCSFDYKAEPEEITIGYLFSHGLADNHRQALNYLDEINHITKSSPINGPLIMFDYPDVSNGYYRLNPTQVTLAQEPDMLHLAQRFYNTFSYHHQAILLGVSRGASTLISFMGTYNPLTVQALVLESPFDTMDHVILDFIQRAGLGWVPGAQRIGMALTKIAFNKFNPDGLKPIDVVKLIYPDLPILFVCSTQDKLVPTWSTINLYLALKQLGHKHVYILILPQGTHAKLINHPEQGLTYQRVVHAFYKKYSLPYNSQLALEGKDILFECQPNVLDLKKYYPSYAQINT